MKNLIQRHWRLTETILIKGSIINALFFAFVFTVNAQAPASFSYQAVVRDLSNNPIANTTLGVQITILRGSTTGSNIFRETHNPVTNSAGLVSLEVGMGNIINGDLQSIDWNNGPYFIEQAIDPAGGTNYTITSTTQLLSVPYALYSRNAGRAESAATADVANSLSASGAGSLSVPLGTILPYAGSAGSVPSGWLLCDGTSYDVNAYPELFALIGTDYGSEPNRFKVPNLNGRTPVGYDINQSEFNALGKADGAKTHTLTTNEMPSHTHNASSSTDGNHNHNYGTRGFLTDIAAAGKERNPGADGSGDNDNLQSTRFAGSHSHTITVNNTGGGAAHNNLQPYLTINFIIKAR